MEKYNVLVDSGEFKERVEDLMSTAKSSIHVQAMTFEGDSVGEWLIEELVKSKTSEKYLCVDSYSKLVINDTFKISPNYLFDSKFRHECQNTIRLLEYAESKGIVVHFTNPLGFSYHKYPLRNHKKIVVVDEEVSFLGGINFSEHNFEWHDMMLEIHDPEIGRELAFDIRNTINGQNQNRKLELGNSDIYFVDGLKSKALYEDLFSEFKNARHSIDIFSPYVSDPLLNYVKRFANPSVEINLITPGLNNKSIFTSIVNRELQKGHINLYRLPGIMSHLKAILIDEKTFIAGSSNFDFISYYFEQEVIIKTSERELVETFKEKVSNPDKAKSEKVDVSNAEVNNLHLALYKSINWLSHKYAKIIS